MMNEERLEKGLTVYMAIYPLFSLKIIYNSWFTLLQILMIIVFFLWVVFVKQEIRAKLKYMALYICIWGIYMFCHNFNACRFQSFIPGDMEYSAIKEMLYLVKLSIPVLFVFLLYFIKVKRENYLKILKAWMILICGSIIATNLLGISLGSYTDEKIGGNIFAWLDPGYGYTELASKGLFMYANQISCILVVMLPFVIFFYYTGELRLLYLVGIMSTLMLLGTRVANLGSVLVFIGIIVLYLCCCVLKRNRINRKKILISMTMILIYAVVLPFSPTAGRNKVYDYILNEPIVYENVSSYKEEAERNIKDRPLTRDAKIEFIENHYEEKLINPQFILESYPYQYDLDFWYSILELPEEMRANYRFLEIAMVKRIVNINNNPFDALWGITNCRIQNVFNIERDYILQYYAYGICGVVLFLGVYFLLAVRRGMLTLKNMNFFNLCQFASIMLFLGIAYLSGNVLGQISACIPVLFLTRGFDKTIEVANETILYKDI